MSGFELTQTIASVATVVAVVLTWLQLIQVKKQARTTFEDRLNEQYRRIMEDIPADIWLGSRLRGAGRGPTGPLPRRHLSLHRPFERGSIPLQQEENYARHVD
jgi:hypothetical protein